MLELGVALGLALWSVRLYRRSERKAKFCDDVKEYLTPYARYETDAVAETPSTAQAL